MDAQDQVAAVLQMLLAKAMQHAPLGDDGFGYVETNLEQTDLEDGMDLIIQTETRGGQMIAWAKRLPHDQATAMHREWAQQADVDMAVPGGRLAVRRNDDGEGGA